MSLPELFIKRHVFAWMLSFVFILVGIIGYQRIGVDRYPHVTFPVISITTIAKGQSPDIIDASITNVIEKTVNSIPGIIHIHSTSSPSVSGVAITFELEKDVDVAFNEVQAKINQILHQLPKNIDPPIVAKVETNASPILWLTLEGDRTLQQLNQYAMQVLKKKLETIQGVGEIRLGGQRDRTIRVNLSPERMAAFKVTSQDVIAAFEREHIQYPSGLLVSQNSEHLINLDFEFHHPDEIGKMIVAYNDSAPVRIQDIGAVEDGLSDFRKLARFNQNNTVGLGLIKITNGNTVSVIDAVHKKLKTEILPELPPGMKLSIASNEALLIKDMIKTLHEHLIEGTLLAAFIVFIFLRSLRSTIIIALAIPVSLMGAIAAIYFFGFTFNTLTLLALLLLIGVVVDDAIVVLENIFRVREHNQLSPEKAAIEGSNQVFFAVLAASLALVCIFAPVIFLDGIIGKFFRSFAVVVTIGVIVSFIVSITLTPMLCARYLRLPTQQPSLFLQRLNGFFNRLDTYYMELLNRALKARWRVLGLTLMVVLASVFFFSKIGKEFVPEEDEGNFIITMRTPLGSNIDYTNQKLKAVEAILSKEPAIKSYFTAVGLGKTGQVNEAMAFVRMAPRAKRSMTQSQVLNNIRQELATISGLQAFAGPMPFIAGQRGEPLQFSLKGPHLEEVSALSQKFLQILRQDPMLKTIDLDLQLSLPEYRLEIDRTKAASLGISSSEIALAIKVLTSGMDVAKYNDKQSDGQRYDIRLKAMEESFKVEQDLAKIFLRSNKGELVRLDTIAQYHPYLGAALISRLDLQYAANFYGIPAIPLSEAAENIKILAEKELPPGFSLQFLGQAEEFSKTAKYMSFTACLAIVMLYMVLASQFNSFIQPLIIMLAQPLAIIGGILLLWLTGKTLNIYSMIGLVLLIGLVAKNSILLVDLTNQYRAQGKAIEEALKEACPIRLRPILMTSCTIILALLPAAFSVGAGGQTNSPLAIAVIGGMISSTLLTLVVVPAVYSLVEEIGQRFRN